jgi:hypothetical protein
MEITHKVCRCTCCGCTEDATTTDDGGVDVCKTENLLPWP